MTRRRSFSIIVTIDDIPKPLTLPLSRLRAERVLDEILTARPTSRRKELRTMARRFLTTALGLLLSLASNSRAFADDPAPPPTTTRLKVLFLGDRGHHVPADRAAQLIPVMAGRGIDMTYTEDVAHALDPKTLAKIDVLLLYANIDAIAPEHAKALLDYVENGGGFAPIHCASYCFRNNADVVNLIGAQFFRHGTGEFDTTIVNADHPIMKGISPFHTWDETYVHSKHNEKDRIVLQTRDEAGKAEPWTWVRTHGKGRVFYTAYGHDWRTWCEPGFQDLIERGLRWASGKGEVYDSRPRAERFERVHVSSRGRPQLSSGEELGHAGRADHEDAKPDLAGRVDEAYGRSARFQGGAVRRRAGHSQADHHGLGPSRPALDFRDGRLSQREAAAAKGATASRFARTPTATARPISSRSSPRT